MSGSSQHPPSDLAHRQRALRERHGELSRAGAGTTARTACLQQVLRETDLLLDAEDSAADARAELRRAASGRIVRVAVAAVVSIAIVLGLAAAMSAVSRWLVVPMLPLIGFAVVLRATERTAGPRHHLLRRAAAVITASLAVLVLLVAVGVLPAYLLPVGIVGLTAAVACWATARNATEGSEDTR